MTDNASEDYYVTDCRLSTEQTLILSLYSLTRSVFTLINVLFTFWHAFHTVTLRWCHYFSTFTIFTIFTITPRIRTFLTSSKYNTVKHIFNYRYSHLFLLPFLACYLLFCFMLSWSRDLFFVVGNDKACNLSTLGVHFQTPDLTCAWLTF